MIVDDDELTGVLLEQLLRRWGYRSYLAENPKKAEYWLRSHYPDLILLDVMMPEMNGMEFIARLRFDLDVTSPVIIMTVLGGEEISQDALQAGACDFIQKPLKPDELKRKVEHALRSPAF